MKRIIATIAIAIPLLAVAGCATTGEAGDTRSVEIAVANEQAGTGTINVWIREEGGTQRLLGTVPPGQTRRFGFQAATAGRYILTAETSDGQRIASDRFAIPAGSQGVSWDLLNNQVTPY